jgi:hypothetical protein
MRHQRIEDLFEGDAMQRIRRVVVHAKPLDGVKMHKPRTLAEGPVRWKALHQM